MSIKKPVGITVIAGLLTVAGGFSTVVIFLELIDSIRFFGPISIGISSIASFVGFLIFAGTPVLLYATGVGLFMSQPWSRKSVVLFIPALAFCFFANLAYSLAYEANINLNPTPYDIISENFDIFVNVFLRYFFLVAPLIFYFTRPLVVFYFEAQKNKTLES